MVEARLICLYLTTMLVNLIYSVMAPFYPLIAVDKGMPPFLIGTVFSAQPIVAVFASCYIGNNLYKFGRRNIYITGLIAGGFSLLILALIENLNYLLFTLLSIFSRGLAGIALAFTYTAGFAIITCDYKDKAQNIVGMMETFGGLGLSMGPVLGALAYPALGFRGIFLLASFSILIFVIPMYFLLKQRHRYSNKNERVSMLQLVQNKVIST